MEYKTITKLSSNEFVEKKSKFICIISPAKTEASAKQFIQKYRNEYTNATHIIPVYALNNNNKPVYYYSDAGEPSKTAGYPILSIIEKQFLTDIVCVVIRYFGGIKLGTGGLVRAYSKVFLNALKKTTIIPFVQYITLQLMFNNYSIQNSIESIICNYHGYIIRKKYADNIEYTVSISKNTLEIIKNELDHLKVIVKIAP